MVGGIKGGSHEQWRETNRPRGRSRKERIRNKKEHIEKPKREEIKIGEETREKESEW